MEYRKRVPSIFRRENNAKHSGDRTVLNIVFFLGGGGPSLYHYIVEFCIISPVFQFTRFKLFQWYVYKPVIILIYIWFILNIFLLNRVIYDNPSFQNIPE